MRLFQTKNQGTISVFLTLILVPVLLFSGIIVDASRLYASKTVISGAGDLTMNAALSEYDKTLKDKYGLIAMAKKPDSEASRAKLLQYFKETCNASYVSGIDQTGIHSMIQLEVSDTDFIIKGVENASLADTQILKQQILEYMKFRAPVYIVDELIQKFKNLPLKNMKEKKDYIKKKTTYGKKLSKLDKSIRKAKEKVDNYQEKVNALQEAAIEANTRGERYQYATVFWLAAYSLSEYMNLSGYLEDSGTNATIQERLYQKITPLGQVVIGKSENGEWVGFDSGRYRTIVDRVRLVSNYKPDDLMGLMESGKLELTDEEIDNYNDLQNIVQSDYTDMHQIYGTEMEDYVGFLTDTMKMVEEVASAGEDAENELKKVKDIWEKDVEKSKREYKESLEVLKQKEEDNPSEGVTLDWEYEEEEEEKTFKLNLDKLTDMYHKIDETQGKLSYLNNQLSASQDLPTHFFNPDQIYFEYNWLEYKGINNVIVNYLWKENNLTLEKTDFTPDNLWTHPFYTDTLAKVNQEKEGESDDKKQSKKDAEESQDKYEEYIEQLKKLDKELDLAKLEGINYPEEFPSKKTTPSSEKKVNKVKVDSDSDSIDDSLGNMSFVNSIINGLDGLTGAALGKTYLLEYMTEMFNCLTTEKEAEKKKDETIKTSLSGDDLTKHKIYMGEIEYILYGNPKTVVNKTCAVSEVYLLRFTIDTMFAFLDKDMNLEADAIATASAALGPWMYPIIKYGYLLCRALVMAGEDVKKLMIDGDEIPVWPQGKLQKQLNTATVKMSYKEYLKLFLLISILSDKGEETHLLRMADLIQLNTGKKLSDCYTMLTIDTKVKTSTFFLPKIPSFLGKENRGDDDGKREIRYRSVLAY